MWLSRVGPSPSEISRPSPFYHARAMIWTAWRVLGYISEMPKRTASPRQQQAYRWRISRLKATPAQYIGEVEASDDASAINRCRSDVRPSWALAVGRFEFGPIDGGLPISG